MTPPLQPIGPAAGGHGEVTHLSVNGEVAEKFRKRLQYAGRQSMPRPLKLCPPEDVRTPGHSCDDAALQTAWKQLCTMAGQGDQDTGQAEDFAQDRFLELLERRSAGYPIECLAACAVNRQMVARRRIDRERHRESHGAAVEHLALAVRLEEQANDRVDSRADGLWTVIRHSRRVHTEKAVLQKMYGKAALREQGLTPLRDPQVSDEMRLIRRDYAEMQAVGEDRWVAEQLFKKVPRRG